MRLSHLLSSACLLTLSYAAQANVTLPALIADNMVLQQQSTVALWGWAEPGEAVTVTASWQKAPVKATADAQGNWLVRVPTGKAGGPYTVNFQGKNQLTVSNVLLGEVWLCSGQSNMAFSISKKPNSGSYTGVINEAQVVPKANYPAIRMFTVKNTVANEPQRDTKGQWQVCSPQTVGEFSAVAYFFAQEIHEHTKLPIGLINSTWGGTPAESWTRRDVLEQDPDFQPILRRYERGLTTFEQDQAAYKRQLAEFQQERAANPQTTRLAPLAPVGAMSNKSPYKLYNGMIRPLIPYTLKGVLWYQGENNADRAYQYRRLFPALIRSWRQEWQQPEMPFYFVQISPHRSQNPEIREAQLLTMQTVPRTGMAVITDWGDSLDIHPRNKQVVGHRLAQWALAKEYGQKKTVYSGPIYHDMQVENGQVRLRFDHTDGGLQARNGPLREFTIAGPDSVFRPAQARIEGNSVIVWNDAVKQPVAVRFAWRAIPSPNFYNAAGLPASPFRTDQWKLKTQGLL
ncbi:sialate O-acetylesterase [Hymenobacter cellulosivorans]|uniref:Sialate O-acetylesterase n=1 Tax=Hymenobacter cellulosivorans TaxID=2932249 RepID=A0ABY4F3N7_9BACT|nr:sialate O-acetylesterase [Hymenobacter cellulosivorans]UOQ51180.1 sialate O-acetylesterase [Hymenobacter cellulosivorans]